MPDENDKKQNESKGFAGLSSLVSDVDTIQPPPAPKKEPPPSVAPTAHATPPLTQSQTRQTHQRPTQPSSDFSGWVAGLAVVIVFFGVFLIIDALNKPTATSPTYSPPAHTEQRYSTPAQSTPQVSAPPAQKTLPAQTPTVQTQTSAHVTSGPTESKPPVGQNLVLSGEQIRYCLAEDIRLNSARTIVNNHSDSDVNRFNAMVTDYNSRCGSFRYHTGALESARRDIERYRSQFQAEGRGRFIHPSTGSLTTPATVRPAIDPTVQAVQRKLNELGYEAGTIDGVMGPRTHSAIVAFQQDRGMVATGLADQALLLQLQFAPARQTAKRRAINPLAQETSSRNFTTATSPQKPSLPANAWVSGPNWYCNDGYRKVGEKCEALTVPENAWVSGSNWYCNDGYRKIGNRCERLNVPSNAWVSGSNWYCNDGFRKVGNQCVTLNVPDNAWSSGSNWYCNDGYRKVGGKCISIFER